MHSRIHPFLKQKEIMKLASLFLGVFITVLFAGSMASAEMPTLRIAALKFGTLNWELNVIKEHKLDHTNGFNLEIMPVAGSAASKVAFQGGEADVILSDWVWVARARNAGKDIRFIPYSKAVGALMVPKGSPIETLADLKNKKIGIAGGPLDKSWIVLRAYALQKLGLDLSKLNEEVYGGAPLIYNAALSGEVDGAINFWHFLARMEAEGMRSVMTVADAAVGLGLDPDIPLLGYVVNGQMSDEQPELVEGLARASRAAKAILATDEAEWMRLRPTMMAKSDAEFQALRTGFIAGIPSSYAVDEANARRFFELMAAVGGRELVGDTTTLPDGVFLTIAD